MKRKTRILLIISAAIVIVVAVLSLWFYKCGDIKNVHRTIPQSEIYSQQDIASAMDVVEKKFKRDFYDCKLTDLWYDESKNTSASGEWAAQYHADEAIVLLSNFTVGPSGGDGSLNPNSTYTNWNWILFRNKGSSTWTLGTWGYG